MELEHHVIDPIKSVTEAWHDIAVMRGVLGIQI